MTDQNKSLIKKIIGGILVVLGILALLTPLTPGSWLIPIGLEMIGVPLVFWDKAKAWLIHKFKSPQ